MVVDEVVQWGFPLGNLGTYGRADGGAKNRKKKKKGNEKDFAGCPSSKIKELLKKIKSNSKRLSIQKLRAMDDVAKEVDELMGKKVSKIENFKEDTSSRGNALLAHFSEVLSGQQPLCLMLLLYAALKQRVSDFQKMRTGKSREECIHSNVKISILALVVVSFQSIVNCQLLMMQIISCVCVIQRPT